jgi:hypothetical protein
MRGCSIVVDEYYDNLFPLFTGIYETSPVLNHDLKFSGTFTAAILLSILKKTGHNSTDYLL